MSQQKEKLTRKEKVALHLEELKGVKKQKPVASGNKQARFLLGIALSVIAFLLYANTLGHEFVLDDSNAVTENHIVKQGVRGIGELLSTDYRAGYWTAKGTLYRPLSLVMFAVEWELFPNNPLPGHFMNVLLYAVTAYLLFTLLCSLLPAVSLIIPFLVTLLFVAHPIHTEVVANIKSRDEILSFLFVLGALHLTLHFIKNGQRSAIIGAGTLYFLSFMAKESSITMLAAVPVMLYFFTNVSGKKIFEITAVFAAGAAVYLFLRRMVLGEITDISDVMLIDNFLIAADNFSTKTATAVMILGKYLGLLFFPHPLSIDYAYNQIPIVNWTNIKPLLSLAAYLVLTGIVVWRWKLKELWVFGILFYLISITLYSNIFFTIGSGFGERFLYVPSLGFCIAVVGALALFFQTTNAEKLSALFLQNKALASIVFLLCIAGSLHTVARNTAWKDHFAIYSSDVKHAPNSARLHYWYANETMKVKALTASNEQEKIKYLDTAIAEYNIALKILPDYADAFGQRGLAYYRKKEQEKAIADYKRAIELKVGQWKVYNNLGVIYGEQNNLQEALKYFKLALKVDTRFPDPYNNIAKTYLMMGDYQNAIKYCFETLKYCTEEMTDIKYEMYAYLALCYEKTGDAANKQKYEQIAKQFAPKK